MNEPIKLILACVIAYLLGSVSTGLILAKVAHGPDLRNVGSGNTGASNVQRTMGWKYGLITFGGDLLKGVLACWIARLLTGDPLASLPAGLLAVIGHNWPIFYGFKGGKGVSTSTGVMLFCYPVPALICMALTVVIIWATRFISLGSMALLTCYAILVSCFYSGGNVWIIAWAAVMALLCVIRHRANIRRLLNGTENKLGSKNKNPEAAK